MGSDHPPFDKCGGRPSSNAWSQASVAGPRPESGRCRREGATPASVGARFRGGALASWRGAHHIHGAYLAVSGLRGVA